MSKEKQIEEIVRIASKCITSWLNNETPKALPDYIAEALYNVGYSKQEWISVDERLPEKNGYYLVYTKYGYIEVERYKTWDDDDLDGGYWWEFEGLVTHWMPLPEPPKMKGGAE